jgi:hypothetical protein
VDAAQDKSSRAPDAKTDAGVPGEEPQTRRQRADKPRRAPTKTGPGKTRTVAKPLRPDVVDRTGYAGTVLAPWL